MIKLITQSFSTGLKTLPEKMGLSGSLYERFPDSVIHPVAEPVMIPAGKLAKLIQWKQRPVEDYVALVVRWPWQPSRSLGWSPGLPRRQTFGMISDFLTSPVNDYLSPNLRCKAVFLSYDEAGRSVAGLNQTLAHLRDGQILFISHLLISDGGGEPGLQPASYLRSMPRPPLHTAPNISIRGPMPWFDQLDLPADLQCMVLRYLPVEQVCRMLESAPPTGWWQHALGPGGPPEPVNAPPIACLHMLLQPNPDPISVSRIREHIRQLLQLSLQGHIQLPQSTVHSERLCLREAFRILPITEMLALLPERTEDAPDCFRLLQYPLEAGNLANFAALIDYYQPIDDPDTAVCLTMTATRAGNLEAIEILRKKKLYIPGRCARHLSEALTEEALAALTGESSALPFHFEAAHGLDLLYDLARIGRYDLLRRGVETAGARHTLSYFGLELIVILFMAGSWTPELYWLLYYCHQDRDEVSEENIIRCFVGRTAYWKLAVELPRDWRAIAQIHPWVFLLGAFLHSGLTGNVAVMEELCARPDFAVDFGVVMFFDPAVALLPKLMSLFEEKSLFLGSLNVLRGMRRETVCGYLPLCTRLKQPRDLPAALVASCAAKISTEDLVGYLTEMSYQPELDLVSLRELVRRRAKRLDPRIDRWLHRASMRSLVLEATIGNSAPS